MRLAAVHSQEPLSGVTILLGDYKDDAVFDKVILSSRKLYTKREDMKLNSTTVVRVTEAQSLVIANTEKVKPLA
jgi:hypothetical protein